MEGNQEKKTQSDTQHIGQKMRHLSSYKKLQLIMLELHDFIIYMCT